MVFGAQQGITEGFADPLDALLRALSPVGDLNPAEMAEAELSRDLLRLARHHSREDAVLAAWILAAVRRDVGAADGYTDTVGWLAWKMCRPRAEIRRALRLAELAELLPATGDAWRDGSISTAAVELIADARVKGHDDELVAMEPEFLDRARRGDRKSLEILTRHFKACARADGSEPAPPDEFSLTVVGDRGVLHGDVAKPAWETIRHAVEKFTRAPGADDGTTLAQRQAEGLVRICEIALARGPGAEGARPVVSYITHRRAADDTIEPLTIGLFSGVVDPRERDRVLCDAAIVPVATDHTGGVLGLGRATPVWNRAQRRAITAKSPHCRWPGCEVPAPWCDIHHIVHWEQGGATDISNGEHLCRRHHVFVHQHRDWTYTFDRQRFRVFRPDRTEVHPDAWHRLAA